MLRERQPQFAKAVLQGELESAVAQFAGDADRILLGLRVHANNAAHAVISAARATFPKTRMLLGDEDFTTASLGYARCAAKPSPVVSEAVADFPSFLESLKEIDPRAARCARFELLRLEAFDAADAESLSPSQFATLDAQAFSRMRTVFHPSLRLYRPEQTDDDKPTDEWRFLTEPHALLRPAFSVEALTLSWPGLDAIEQLAAGRTVGEALESSEDMERTLYDLGRLINAGAVSQLLSTAME
jgi:hypothetical protein